MGLETVHLGGFKIANKQILSLNSHTLPQQNA